MKTTEQLISDLSKELLTREWKLVTAESCTGGGLAYAITNMPGSSNWFDRGFVTYSNNAKEECLGVLPETLTHFGAVSKETAQEMAQGALQHSEAQLSIAITGIAGPDGGSKEKPVGTVWIAITGIGKNPKTHLNCFHGNRIKIREDTIIFCLNSLIQYLN